MSLQKVALSLIHEFILGVAFFCSLWIRLGLEPQESILQKFSMIINNILPITYFPYLFWLIPIFVLLLTIVGSFYISGWLGLASIGLIFSSGFFIENIVGAIMLFIALVVGLFAPWRE